MQFVPEDIPPGLCSVINYSFASLDPNSLTIVPSDPYADITLNMFGRLVDHKRHGSKVLIALGGWTDSGYDKYTRLISNPAARANFIQHSISFIEQYGFDGLDLDYEYVGCRQGDCGQTGPAEKQYFNDFVRELQQAYTPRGWYVSAAVPIIENVLNVGYDIAYLGQQLSFINLMMYDMAGTWEGKTGHHAVLHNHEWSSDARLNVEWGVNYWIQQGAPANKLMMGVPLYGRSFTLANPGNSGMGAPITGVGEQGEYTREAGYLAYFEICQRTNFRGYATHQDPAYRFGPYSWSGSHWIGYDSTTMLERKVDFAKSKGLGGAMVW